MLLEGIFAYNALHLIERLLDVVERYFTNKLREAGKVRPPKTFATVKVPAS